MYFFLGGVRDYHRTVWLNLVWTYFFQSGRRSGEGLLKFIFSWRRALVLNGQKAIWTTPPPFSALYFSWFSPHPPDYWWKKKWATKRINLMDLTWSQAEIDQLLAMSKIDVLWVMLTSLFLIIDWFVRKNSIKLKWCNMWQVLGSIQKDQRCSKNEIRPKGWMGVYISHIPCLRLALAEVAGDCFCVIPGTATRGISGLFQGDSACTCTWGRPQPMHPFNKGCNH